MLRGREFKIEYNRGLCKHEFITLGRLKDTIKSLKQQGGDYYNNKWSSPIVPLLSNHVFTKIDNVQDVVSITLKINKGKDIKC